MAKLTALEIVNQVLKNTGLPTKANLLSLTRIEQVALDFINETIVQLASEDKWTPLVTTGSITLVTSQEGYNKSAISPTIDKVDRDSFRLANTGQLKWVNEEELDDLIHDRTAEGEPRYIFERGDQILFNYIPNAANNGKIVTFRYWKLPDLIDVNTPSGTTWFPEPYDQTVLVNLSSAKLLAYRRNPEATEYLQKVEGVRGFLQGSLNAMRAKHITPSLSRIKVKVL